MPDEIQKSFVRSFVTFLKSQIGADDMAADAQESVEVAIQCLQAAFDIEEDETSSDGNAGASGGASATQGATGDKTASADTKIDLFNLYQAMYIEKNPETAELAESIKNQGNRLMEEGKYNEALLQYNRAIAFNPRNPIYYCNRAAAHIRLGDNERAVTDCKSALVYNPNYSRAYGRLGIAYSNLGKYEEAEQAYTKAIELEPNNQDYRNNLEVARNDRTQAPVNAIPQLTAGLNAMLSNPTIRNIFRNADIDLEQLQGMSQNPVIMNAIGQMFTGIPVAGGAASMGASGGGAPPIPNDMLQLFQTFASQLASASGERPTNNSGNNNQSDRQPPST